MKTQPNIATYLPSCNQLAFVIESQVYLNMICVEFENINFNGSIEQ
jgi:hypothetical protein